jgi:hypothetical protein
MLGDAHADCPRDADVLRRWHRTWRDTPELAGELSAGLRPGRAELTRSVNGIARVSACGQRLAPTGRNIAPCG